MNLYPLLFCYLDFTRQWEHGKLCTGNDWHFVSHACLWLVVFPQGSPLRKTRIGPERPDFFFFFFLHLYWGEVTVTVLKYRAKCDPFLFLFFWIANPTLNNLRILETAWIVMKWAQVVANSLHSPAVLFWVPPLSVEPNNIRGLLHLRPTHAYAHACTCKQNTHTHICALWKVSSQAHLLPHTREHDFGGRRWRVRSSRRRWHLSAGPKGAHSAAPATFNPAWGVWISRIHVNEVEEY